MLAFVVGAFTAAYVATVVLVVGLVVLLVAAEGGSAGLHDTLGDLAQHHGSLFVGGASVVTAATGVTAGVLCVKGRAIGPWLCLVTAIAWVVTQGFGDLEWSVGVGLESVAVGAMIVSAVVALRFPQRVT